MKVRAQFSAIVCELTHPREELLDVDDKATGLDVWLALATKDGEEFRRYILDSGTGNPKLYIQFLVKKDSISTLMDSTVLAGVQS